ncbi:hypothetical protein RHMOL_Rhmol09G0097000 [Rhododendron molle]|uniref:Uncharacterized protein n=1 Tax=Rhododendron molle TaxID=49168 RepID=A0ACC0MBU2_RHOML|nr:hypothetical protein RHMOL_Rhmol09G0097000 [Rhododendron molle]
MADHDGNGSGGEVVNRTRDEGASMEPEIENQMATVANGNTGAEATGGGDDGQGCEQEAAGGEEHRAAEAEPARWTRLGPWGPELIQ